MKLVETWCEFSKSAQDLVLTANRKGMDLNPWDPNDAYQIPFEKGFTRRDVANELRFFRESNHLTVAKFVGAEFIELDSTNMSHAGAYFKVRVLVREDEAKKAELI